MSTPPWKRHCQKTPGWSNPDSPGQEGRARADRLHPLGQMGIPEQIAGLIAYLASDEASYSRGEDIVIDGGLRSVSSIATRATFP